MKLSLMTAIALPLVAAAATEGDFSWGTDKSFGAVLAAADIAVSGHTDDQPSYCYMPPPNQKCYRDGYPKCCNKTKGNCPINKAPGCECDGDCTEEVSCLYPNDACGSDEFCMIQEGACRQRSATVSGLCTDMPKMCVANFDPVCGCDGETYANSCQAAGAGVNVEHNGECRNDNKRPGSSYCTWSPDYDCYKEGWPQCCGDDDQTCPDSQPRCDKGAPGWDYCAWEPDYDCYSNGHPKCCQRFQGTNCMTDKPNCDNPTENSEDGFNVKFLRSN